MNVHDSNSPVMPRSNAMRAVNEGFETCNSCSLVHFLINSFMRMEFGRCGVRLDSIPLHLNLNLN